MKRWAGGRSPGRDSTRHGRWEGTPAIPCEGSEGGGAGGGEICARGRRDLCQRVFVPSFFLPWEISKQRAFLCKPCRKLGADDALRGEGGVTRGRTYARVAPYSGVPKLAMAMSYEPLMLAGMFTFRLASSTLNTACEPGTWLTTTIATRHTTHLKRKERFRSPRPGAATPDPALMGVVRAGMGAADAGACAKGA